MTVLLFFFNLLHWSCFISLSQGLPHIDALHAESGLASGDITGQINAMLPTKHNLNQVWFKLITAERLMIFRTKPR